jgi:hypothetical protein
MGVFKKFFISTVLTTLTITSLLATELSTPPMPPTDTINNTNVSNDIDPSKTQDEQDNTETLLTKKIAEIYLREVLSGLINIDIQTTSDQDKETLRLLYLILPDLDMFTYDEEDGKDHIVNIYMNYVTKRDIVKLKTPLSYDKKQLLTVLRKNNLERKLRLPRETLDCIFSPLNTLIQFVPNPGGITGMALSKALTVTQTGYIKTHEMIKRQCSRETYSDFAKAQGPKITTKILENEITKRIEAAQKKFMHALKLPAMEIHDVLLSTDNLTPTKVMTYKSTDYYGYPEITKTLKTIFSSKNKTQRVDVHDYGTEMVYWVLNSFTSLSDRGRKPTDTYREFVLKLDEIADGKNNDIHLPKTEAYNLKIFTSRSLAYLKYRSLLRKTLVNIHKTLVANSSALAAAAYNAHTSEDTQKHETYLTKLMNSILNTNQMSLY